MKNPENGGSNELPVFEAHEQELTDIKKLVADADAKLIGHRKSLYGALGRLFELTQLLQEGAELESFARSHGLDFGKVAQKNPFQPLVSLAFAGSAGAPAISKYATLLQYAEKEKPADAVMADWIDAEGGIEDIVARARQSTTSEFDRLFEETTEEHLARAQNVLAQQMLGSIEAPAGLRSSVEGASSEYRRALVRHNGGKVEIVGIIDTSETEVQQDVFRLVPAEAPLARRRLKDKAYYSLFRAADIAGRFMQGLGEDDGSAKVSIKDRYLPDTGLEVRRGADSHWTVRTIGTQPSFIVAELQLTDDFDSLGAGPFLFSHGGIRRLARDFPYSENWDVRKRLPAGPNGTDIATDGEVLLDDLPTSKSWRSLNPKCKTIATLTLSQSRLLELSRWPGSYRETTRSAGVGGFPKLLLVSIEGSELGLSFPHYRKLGQADLAALNSQQRELHELQHRQLAQLDKPTTMPIGQHWLRRADLLAIAKLSFDYGLSFSAELRAVADGLCLRLIDDSGAIQLNVPLAVSQAGDYAAIVI